MEAIDIITALKSGAISEEQAARLIESYPKKKKFKKKPKVPAKMGRPRSEKKAVNYQVIIAIWVGYSDVGVRGTKTKLRVLLADALGVEISYIDRCLARFHQLIKCGDYHVYKYVDNDNSLSIMILNNQELQSFIHSPKRAFQRMQRGTFLNKTWSFLSSKSRLVF